MNSVVSGKEQNARIVHFHEVHRALEAEKSLLDQFQDPSARYKLFFWTTEQCLVAPKSLRRAPNIDKAMLSSKAAGWPVHFRQTGGDITPQGSGVLNIAVAFALDPLEIPTISGVYEVFCSPLLRWLAQIGCKAKTGYVNHCFCDGEYNVVVDGSKVAGTAQRWTRVRGEHSRQLVFAHALVLIDADLHSGVDAMNRIYDNCGMEHRVQVDVHSNLVDIVNKPREQLEGEILCNLTRLYQAELEGMTL